jgi:hypothetical protein
VNLESLSRVRTTTDPLISGLQASASRSLTSGPLGTGSGPGLFGGGTLPSEDVIGKEKNEYSYFDFCRELTTR